MIYYYLVLFITLIGQQLNIQMDQFTPDQLSCKPSQSFGVFILSNKLYIFPLHIHPSPKTKFETNIEQHFEMIPTSSKPNPLVVTIFLS